METFNTLHADVTLTDIPINELHAAPWNARRYFESAALHDLARDLTVNGQAQPILVRPKETGGYEVIAGERRLRAARLANLSTLSAVIRELGEREARRLSIAENLNREDLNPYEETIGVLDLLAFEFSSGRKWADLLSEHASARDAAAWVVTKCRASYPRVHAQATVALGMDEEDLEAVFNGVFGDRVGMTLRSFVNNRLPLLSLPEDIREAMEDGQLDYSKANTLARVKDPEQRTDLVRRTIEEDLNLQAVIELVQAVTSKHEIADEERDSVRSNYRTVTRYFRYFAALNSNERKKVDRLLRELGDVLKRGASKN